MPTCSLDKHQTQVSHSYLHLLVEKESPLTQEMQCKHHICKLTERHSPSNRKTLPSNPRNDDLLLHAASDLPRGKPCPCPEWCIASKRMG